MKFKKILFLIVCAMPIIARAQLAVVDVSPDRYIYQSKTVAAQIQQISEAVKSNSSLVSIVNTAIQTKQDISDMLKLENDAKAALLTVRNISDLKWSDMSSTFTAATGISLNYTGLIPSASQGNSARIFTPGSGFGDGAKSIFYTFNGRDQGGVQTETSMINGLQQSNSTRLQLDDASSIRKLQVAEFYNKMADDMATKAVELTAALNTESKFSMTSAERLNLLKQCNDLMLQSAQLRIKADELRQDAVKPSLSQTEKMRQDKQNILFTQMQNKTTTTN